MLQIGTIHLRKMCGMEMDVDLSTSMNMNIHEYEMNISTNNNVYIDVYISWMDIVLTKIAIL